MRPFGYAHQGKHGQVIVDRGLITLCINETLQPGNYTMEFLDGVLPNVEIKNVIFHDPATIVFWSDNTKTVVKKGENDIYDPEKGLAMAIVKKALGNQGNYYNLFKKWLPKEVVIGVDRSEESKSIEKEVESYSGLMDKIKNLRFDAVDSFRNAVETMFSSNPFTNGVSPR